MKKKNNLRYWTNLLVLSCYLPLSAQYIYVNDGGTFYLKSTLNFSAGSSPVSHHENGVFALEGGVSWSDVATYVDGEITVYGGGTTIVNVGDEVQSLINITTEATDEIVCDYTRTAPVGSLDPDLAGYELSDNEYWTVSQISGSSVDVNISVTAMLDATYGGTEPNKTPVLVRYNTSNAHWELYSDSPGFGDFSFAVDQSILDVNDVIAADSFKLYPNPISKNETSINYVLPSNVTHLGITIYDFAGKLVEQHTALPINKGVNTLQASQLVVGIYFIQFSFNNGIQVIRKKLIVQ